MITVTFVPRDHIQLNMSKYHKNIMKSALTNIDFELFLSIATDWQWAVTLDCCFSYEETFSDDTLRFRSFICQPIENLGLVKKPKWIFADGSSFKSYDQFSVFPSENSQK